MLRLGERQDLNIVKKVDFGVYLSEEGDDTRILLPKKEVPEGSEIGDSLNVFLYKDSKDRLIATMREPKLMRNGIALLQVKEVGQIGAFLDWGLDKDLFLPFKEQTRRVRAGEECLAGLYIDKSSRLCATMNVYPYPKMHSPYQINDMVKGRIYETSDNFGVFVAVDDQYSALIPKKDAAGQFTIGEVIEARVTNVKEDGKLDLTVRDKAYLQMDEDAELVMKVLDEFDGVLPFNDKVSPEVIKREFGLSKNAFKRAVGRLYKQGKIEITENRILKKA
ncbi:MAG: S1-like domain-containing RNA-binding protein [Lachnospiraceae bacterium]|nr:S1-like domain-containing RNA-binding protein [Lachnospiraceae bacterium]